MVECGKDLGKQGRDTLAREWSDKRQHRLQLGGGQTRVSSFLNTKRDGREVEFYFQSYMIDVSYTESSRQELYPDELIMFYCKATLIVLQF